MGREGEWESKKEENGRAQMERNRKKESKKEIEGEKGLQL